MKNIKTYFIDGYNVMYKMPRLKSMMKADVHSARQFLTDQIKIWLQKSINVVLVFDGVPDELVQHYTRIKIIYSKNRTADFVIRNQLEDTMNTKTVCVISSDHEVQNHARTCGAHVMKSEEFIQLFNPKEQNDPEEYKSRTMNKGEIDMWLEEFKRKNGE